MKKNKITFAIVPFILGGIFGISIFAFLSFTRTSAPVNPPAGPTTISAVDANVLVKKYLTTALVSPTPIKGFYIDLQQLDAMNKLLKENATLAGFRVYIGKTLTDVLVGIVVGVDNKGLDAVSNSIYKTDSPKTGPCPTVCDQGSPVSKD